MKVPASTKHMKAGDRGIHTTGVVNDQHRELSDTSVDAEGTEKHANCQLFM